MASYDPTKDNERRETCEFILVSGKHLQMPQLTISTAIILFHRFYTKYTFENYDKKKIGVTCLFLAGKIQETPKKIKDVIKCTYNVDVEKPDFAPLRDEILKYERVLLQAISFEFSIEPPYHELVRQAKKMLGVIQIPEEAGEKWKETFYQVAWNFVNDSLKTTLCLQYEPKLIASASIYLALQYMGIKNLNSIPIFDILQASLVDLENISNQILDLYEETNLQKFSTSNDNNNNSVK